MAESHYYFPTGQIASVQLRLRTMQRGGACHVWVMEEDDNLEPEVHDHR